MALKIMKGKTREVVLMQTKMMPAYKTVNASISPLNKIMMKLNLNYLLLSWDLCWTPNSWMIKSKPSQET